MEEQRDAFLSGHFGGRPEVDFRLTGKGWWTILRLYNPLQPFFDKTWRPSEIEPT
jgi:hypothetical protein